MSNELLSVRLRKPWGQNEAGALVLVDKRRAARLEELEIGSIEPPDNTRGVADEGDDSAVEKIIAAQLKAPKRAPRDKMVRASKTKGKK